MFYWAGKITTYRLDYVSKIRRVAGYRQLLWGLIVCLRILNQAPRQCQLRSLPTKLIFAAT